MELVEGETLADRIARGPIPLDEALTIAKQIANALEAAHDGTTGRGRTGGRRWPPASRCLPATPWWRPSPQS
jgi:hypothetical protein